MSRSAARAAPRPAVPARSGDARASRVRSTRRWQSLPILSPHGHTDPQWYADDAPFAGASALFITPDHYVFRMLYSQGIRLEDLGIPRRDGARGGAGRAQDLADVRRALPPVSRHADADLARPRVRHRLRLHRAADRRIRRPHLRPHQRLPGAAGVPSARAVRALQHRGDRDDRIAARPARPSPQDPRRRAGRAASSPRTGPIRSSIRSSRASATTCCSWAR